MNAPFVVCVCVYVCVCVSVCLFDCFFNFVMEEDGRDLSWNTHYLLFHIFLVYLHSATNWIQELVGLYKHYVRTIGEPTSSIYLL